MRIAIALVSQFKDKNLKLSVDEFVKRANKFAQVDFLEFKKGESLLEVKQKYKQYHVVALAEKGKEFNSLDFAKHLDKIATYESGNILLVISDADGFKPEELQDAKEVLSLGKITMPHELATLVLSEQVYRALSILNNHPYHRE